MNAFLFKKGDYIKHPNPKVDWGVGIVQADCRKGAVSLEAVFSKVGLKSISLDLVIPVLLDASSLSVNQVTEAAVKSRVYFDEPFADIFQDLKSKLKDFVVIIENGVYYEVLYEDAELFGNMFGWTVYERSPGQPLTGFPLTMEKVWPELKSRHIPYVVVSQIPSTTTNKICRQVREIFCN